MNEKVRCLSCEKLYNAAAGGGTCRECYLEAAETEDEMEREIDDLKSKIAFLRLSNQSSSSCLPPFTDVVLVASDECGDGDDGVDGDVAVSAHRAVLVSRSPVFKAMFEVEMEESISGTIKISDVTCDSLRAFVNYMYTAEVWLDEQIASELLVLGEKYQVKHLKEYCEKYLVSKLNWDNSVSNYVFAYQNNAGRLLKASLTIISDNMNKFLKTKEYVELVEKDPTLVVGIFEFHLANQENTAAKKA
ncbi:BTB/POZ domain-containing protein [Drosera capensis]